MNRFILKYGMLLALISGLICIGGLSLAQQPVRHGGPHRIQTKQVAQTPAPVPTPKPEQPAAAPAPSTPPVQVDPQPVAIGGPVGQPTYVIAPAPAAAPPTVIEQKKPGGLIDIGQAFNDSIAPYINAAVNALILAVVGFLAKRFTDKTGIQVDQAHRDAIVRGLQNQAGSLLADGKVKMQGLSIHVDNDAVANAANNLLKSLPDAQKHFGLTPEYVEKRIIDMIPQTSAGAALVAQAHTGDTPATAADVAASGAATVAAAQERRGA